MKVMDTELYKFAITTEAQFKWVNGIVGELCLSKAIKMSAQIRCATQNKWCRDKVYKTLMSSKEIKNWPWGRPSQKTLRNTQVVQSKKDE